MRKKIREKIKKRSSITRYAQEVEILQCQLSNFLNSKSDIRVSTLEKILKPIGFSVSEDLPYIVERSVSVCIDEETYCIGDIYKEKKIEYLFESPNHIFMVLDDNKMRIIEK